MIDESEGSAATSPRRHLETPYSLLRDVLRRDRGRLPRCSTRSTSTSSNQERGRRRRRGTKEEEEDDDDTDSRLVEVEPEALTAAAEKKEASQSAATDAGPSRVCARWAPSELLSHESGIAITRAPVEASHKADDRRPVRKPADLPGHHHLARRIEQRQGIPARHHRSRSDLRRPRRQEQYGEQLDDVRARTWATGERRRHGPDGQPVANGGQHVAAPALAPVQPAPPPQPRRQPSGLPARRSRRQRGG